MKEKRQCLRCETPFENNSTSGRPAVYCSRECRNNDENERRNARRAARRALNGPERNRLIDLTCQHCGTPFQARTSKAKWCSKQCGHKEQHLRNYKPAEHHQAYCAECGIEVSGQARVHRICRTCQKQHERTRGRNRTASATCLQCGTSFTYAHARKAQPHRYCSKKCSGEAQRSDRICNVDGCGQPHSGRGYCADHYWKNRRKVGIGKTCEAPECDKPMHGRGLCVNHYNDKYFPRQSSKQQAICQFCKSDLPGRSHPTRTCDNCKPKAPTKNCEICGLPSGRRKRCEKHWGLSNTALGIPRKNRGPNKQPRPKQEPALICQRGHPRRCTSGGNWYCPTCARPARRNGKAKRRARENGGNMTTAQWKQILSLAGDHCFYCPGPYEVMEHVTPLARGGRHDFDNVVPACHPCNTEKGAKTVEEWRPEEAELIIKRLARLAEDMRQPSLPLIMEKVPIIP